MATDQELPQSFSPSATGETDDRTALLDDARNWDHLQDLFHSVQAAPREEREAALNTATTDPVLRARVLSLLEMEDAFEPTLPDAGNYPTSGRVGPYSLLRHLGSGGLGSVYLSERVIGGAIQQCAVKLLSMRGMEPAFRSRFHREQQILATLNHPNITRLLDAGISSTNQPYLVMDFVDGVDLTAFCNEQHLSVERRLGIFLSVCNAVAYAHRNLVVHLDLKPSNILVTGDATVKLLDFGTSKLITPDSAITTTVLATPAYASPEQLRGEAVTTGCDVYSLGAVLYELLTGQRPFRITSMAMAVGHATREDEPEPITSALTAKVAASFGMHLEKLRSELRGDLASIVARCLRSRSQDRYPSVDALTADLKRYLDGRPVAARRQTAAYRLSKFTRRNRGRIAAASAVLLVLVAAGIFSVMRQQQALRQGRRAEQMQSFMTRLLRLSHSGATGKPAATVAEMLQVGAQILPSFISDPADLRAARLNMAESMYDDDDFKDALPILLDLVKDAKKSGDLDVEAKAEVLAGDIGYLTGKVSDGDTFTSNALALVQNRAVSPEVRTEATTIYVSDHDDVGDRSEHSMDLLRKAIAEAERSHVPEDQLASAMNTFGLGLQARGHIAEAQPYFERSLAIYRKTPYATCDAAMTERYLAVLKGRVLDSAGALPLYQESYNLLKKCAGEDDLGTLSAQSWVASTLTDLGQPSQAVTILEPAIPRWKKAVGPESIHLNTPLTALTRAYLALGRYRDAELTARESLTVMRGKVSQQSVNMANVEELLGEALDGQSRYQEALPLAEAAARDYPPSATATPLDTLRKRRTEDLLAETQKHLKAAADGPMAQVTK